MQGMTAKAPWKDHLEGLPCHVDYFSGSMYRAVKAAAERWPDGVALDFQGASTTYRTMFFEIERCARAFRTIGIREGDRVTIALPNCPQAIYSLYALNCIGAVANMIHPLSAEREIEFYLTISESVMVITLDQFYEKFEAIRARTHVVNIVLASIKDALSLPVRIGYLLTEGRKVPKVPADAPVIRWNRLMALARSSAAGYEIEKGRDDVAVILYSGGTTGTTKGIELTNGNPLPEGPHRHRPLLHLSGHREPRVDRHRRWLPSSEQLGDHLGLRRHRQDTQRGSGDERRRQGAARVRRPGADDR